MPVATNKVLEILFVLDVSRSMNRTYGRNNKTAMQLLNEQLKQFIEQLKSVAKIRVRGEVGVITFTDTTEFSPFVPLSNFEMQECSTREGYTYTAHAMNEGLDQLEMRLQQTTRFGRKNDISIVVLITDGNPDENEDIQYQMQVIERVNRLCAAKDIRHKILPFIIGVGDSFTDETKNILASYSKGFINGFFHVRGDSNAEMDFKALFKNISESIVASVDVNEAHMDTLLHRLSDMVNIEYPRVLCIM